jgi:hypothetical protein
LASKCHWTVSFSLSNLWSKFKSAEQLGNTEMVFVLLQSEEELQEEEAAKTAAAVSVDDPLANDLDWSIEQEEAAAARQFLSLSISFLFLFPSKAVPTCLGL